MTSWQHHELVAARAGAILTSTHTAEAYARHFEAQLRTVRFRVLVHVGWSELVRALSRPDAILLAVIVIPCVMLCSAAPAVPSAKFSGTGSLTVISTFSDPAGAAYQSASPVREETPK